MEQRQNLVFKIFGIGIRRSKKNTSPKKKRNKQNKLKISYKSRNLPVSAIQNKANHAQFGGGNVEIICEKGIRIGQTKGSTRRTDIVADGVTCTRLETKKKKETWPPKSHAGGRGQ